MEKKTKVNLPFNLILSRRAIVAGTWEMSFGLRRKASTPAPQASVSISSLETMMIGGDGLHTAGQ